MKFPSNFLKAAEPAGRIHFYLKIGPAFILIANPMPGAAIN